MLTSVVTTSPSITPSLRCHLSCQAKRVNIGVSIITHPMVLFLDEPTSGLDSFTADEVMTFVQTLTQDGMTVCATIHSPSPTTFALFDRIMLLVGKCYMTAVAGCKR